MKKTSKGIIAAVVVGASFATGMFADTLVSTIQAELHKDLTIIVDGEKQAFEDANGATVYPIMYNGTTYLPVRAIGNLMGKNVGWDEATQTITLKAPTYDLGGSLVYEDGNIEIRFKKTYIERDAWGDQYGVKFTVKNKTDENIRLNLDSFAANGITYSGLYVRYDDIAPNSTTVVDCQSLSSDSDVYSTFPASGVKTISGRMYYRKGDNSWLDYTYANFANVNVE